MEKIVISSVNNPKIKHLKQIQKDNKSDYFLVSGYHLVNEALAKNLVVEIFELENKNTYKTATLVKENVLKSISNLLHPDGVVALCIKPNHKIGNKIILLDNVQDPGNVGTIIRNAACFNFDTVISNVNFYNDKVIRATQGALFSISLIKEINNEALLRELSKNGYYIIATSLEKDSIKLDELKINSKKLVIILGNEGRGISKNLYKYCDQKVYIPIEFESLNVAVASGIILNNIYNNKK
ncbi:RNA methyltransferase [Mycoplasmopsis caviae]|uniref:RNA methyltransferase n=1 Tax=Mycoplasmopsis caviae TaxID=55603 RepID=A0A3P8KX10_9BACT|nr:RNA methyltransferase [Mycoplasmopsis caviae]UUD35126.1 RNA methyltransferase [Mycoplasmopsis caviae]VDR42057.1 tRNA/rRNA methylase [Mycoplasmopsis caviae]